MGGIKARKSASHGGNISGIKPKKRRKRMVSAEGYYYESTSSLERKQEGMKLRGRTVSASHGGNGGGQKAKKGRKEKTGRDSAEGCGSDYETEKRQKMERKKNVKAELDSSNDSTSSKDARKRRQQEDGSDDNDEWSGESESEVSQAVDEDMVEAAVMDNVTREDDEDEVESGDSGEYDEAAFLQKCVQLRYAQASRTGFDQRYENMKIWLARHKEHKHYLPLETPFSNSLCILWCNHQMRRKNKKGDLLGPGSLFAHIQMLKFKGFISNQRTVPAALESFFKNAHEAHKRTVMKRVDDCEQALPDSHAQNASWQAIQYACEKTHDWMPGRGHDPRTNLFLTGAIQTISRGERVGKVPTTAFRMGHTGDHICAGEGLSSKTNQKGDLSYDKRFWPNYTNGKMCFVNALGRHLLCQKRNELSTFLFMSKTEEQKYRRKLKASQKNKNHKGSHIGPHLKFDRLIGNVFKKLPSQKRIAMGISSIKNFVGHCKRKAAFARAVEGDGPDGNMVGNRADHRTNNHRTYSARGIGGVKGSGGPPPRHDITISKLLGGLTQYTPEFNADPPHWDAYVIERIPWTQIMPCYEEQPEGMQSLVPLSVAQVVYHYHKSKCGLSSSHDLFKSPLWTTHAKLRSQLFKALRGADTEQKSVLSTTYRDKKTDVYLWTKSSHETMNEMQKDITELKTLQREQMELQRGIIRRLDGQGCVDVQLPYSGNDADAHISQHEDAQVNATPGLPLDAAPAVFTIPDGISVETAWHGWHGSYHNDETGGNLSYPWKRIDKNSRCLSTVSEEREKTLGLLSKIGMLVKFLQGDKTEDEVEKGVSHAWDVCKESAMQTLRAHGITEWPLSGSIRTAYMALGKLKKGHPEAFHIVAKRNVHTIRKVPVVQTEITFFFNPGGHLEDLTDTILVEEQPVQESYADSETRAVHAFELFGTSTRPAEDCYICPCCPESGGAAGRDLVVYRDSTALWQHWDKHHSCDQKPALWEIQRVQGAKLQVARSSPWTRVENARSFFVPEHNMKKMRSDIKAGRRKVENGTFVELEPGAQEKTAGMRWFAVVRDSRLQSGKITVEHCEENTQTIKNGQIQKVWVESLLRVGGVPHHPFDDVSPPRTPQKRAGAQTSTKAQVSQSSPAGISTSAKKPKPADQESTAGSDTSSIQHEQAILQIESHIKKKTNNSSNAKNAFADANARLVQGHWKRCITKEGTGTLAPQISNSNLQHKKFTVQLIPRDGDCLFHCFVHILAAESATVKTAAVPKNVADLRKQMHEWARDIDEERKSKHGGFYTHDGEWIPLENSLLRAYGGAQEIMAFTNMYNVTVHVHAPETVAGMQTYQGSTAEAHEYNLLQTLGWIEWCKDDNNNFVRSWGGDHWQVIKVNDCRKMGAAQASTAKTAVKLPHPGPARKLEYINCDAGQQPMNDPISAAISAAPEEQMQATQTGSGLGLPPGTASPPPLASTPAPAPAPAAAPTTAFAARPEVQLVLRAVKTHPYMCNAEADPKNPTDNLALMKIGSTDLMVYNFQNHFDRVYPSHVRKILHAFPDLNEDGRSFFLALGIGMGMDPFTLQCLFRIQGEKIRPCSATPGIQSVLEPGRHVDFGVLRWCWPPDFDQFSVLIIESTRNAPHSFKLFESNGATKERKLVILLHDKTDEIYMLLRHHTGEQSVLTHIATKIQVETTEMRCPSISTLSQFKCFQNESVFLAAALQGTEPPQSELDAIWKKTVNELGLDFDPVTEAWTGFPLWAGHLAKTESKKDNLKDGSMLQESWKLLRTKLLGAFDPMPQTPCTFVDAGSETGRGLYHMIGDKRVTHVAGVEYQLAWFKLSQNIFNSVRNEFERRRYRMPEVTLIHSCMIAPKPVLKWLYSISSIMWMNNFVYDKYAYFSSTNPLDANYKGNSLLKTKDLTPNAAYNFSLKFEDTTLIAVHYPDAFLEKWNYTTCEQFQVSCTWSQTSTKEKVTILRHTQHLKITNECTLPSPTMAASNNWDSWTQQWSDIASAGSQSPGPSFECPKWTIPWRMFSTLAHRNWLCTQILRGYIEILRIQFPNTTFDEFTEISTKSTKQLQRQFDKDMNVFVFNLNDVHWIGAKLEKSNRRILVYDSYPGTHEPQFKKIEELATRLGVPGPIEHIDVKVPYQENAFDCGVTTCLFMLCMAHNIDNGMMYHSPTVMRQFRLTLFADILDQKVTDFKYITD